MSSVDSMSVCKSVCMTIIMRGWSDESMKTKSK